jgi:hypothetical protein
MLTTKVLVPNLPDDIEAARLTHPLPNSCPLPGSIGPTKPWHTLEQLSDIKAKLIVGIANDRVRWTNVKHFRQLLPAPQMKASSMAT